MTRSGLVSMSALSHHLAWSSRAVEFHIETKKISETMAAYALSRPEARESRRRADTPRPAGGAACFKWMVYPRTLLSGKMMWASIVAMHVTTPDGSEFDPYISLISRGQGAEYPSTPCNLTSPHATTSFEAAMTAIAGPYRLACMSACANQVQYDLRAPWLLRDNPHDSVLWA